MNITELARTLKVTPQELRRSLPEMGFDIGRKAIKVNKSIANRIIREWPKLKRELDEKKKRKILEEKKEEEEKMAKGEVLIPGTITVRDFSDITGISVSKILSELMKNGVFASLNEKIDFDTAWLIGSEMGLEIKRREEDPESEGAAQEDKLKEIIAREDKAKLLDRPPVIVVMGHVDHGKTKLLDAIRKTNIVDDEAGGITQHIGAYQVERKGQAITFVDTPGHEAFTAMRSRGAKIADIAILVVAADDGVKPQTIEAYRIIKAAGIPFVVAINKIDKDGANVDKTKQELSSQLGIVPEDWGGKVICSPISAKQNQGITELLDMVLLTANTETDNIKANPEADAAGTIIESNVDKGAGPVATILVQNGTLRVGDQLVSRGVIVGKIKNLKNYKKENIDEAGPAMPARIMGLKTAPEVGEILEVGEGAKVKHKKYKSSASMKPQTAGGEEEEEKKDEAAKINLIIKSDVLGSAEAIEESLVKLNNKKVKINILHKGLGNITDGDIKKAEASGAVIVGFNVKSSPAFEELAREMGVEIKLYSIIYDLINDIKEKMQSLVKADIKRTDLGKLKVAAIFHTDKKSQIAGGQVIEGNAESNSLIEVYRDKEFIANGKMTRLQSGKENVDKVEAGQECGVQFEGKPVIAEGDILLFYKEEEIIEMI